MPTTHLDFALKNVRGLCVSGIYGSVFAFRNKAQAMQAARMVGGPRLNEIWKLEREADRLRKARDNLQWSSRAQARATLGGEFPIRTLSVV